MIALRKSSERGHFNHGWLDTFHTFSFAEYVDRRHMGFRSLRVINEDRVKPGQGFATHSHRDMEIITYILKGALEHKDSMGNTSVIRPGEIQRMSAGTGVTHSEFNPSPDEEVHLLQIWIFPERKNLAPEYEQKSFPAEEKTNRLRLVVSPDGRDGSVTLHQDALIHDCLLEEGRGMEYSAGQGRGLWVQVTAGILEVGGQTLRAGDGASLEGEPFLASSADGAAFLLFDLGS